MNTQLKKQIQKLIEEVNDQNSLIKIRQYKEFGACSELFTFQVFLDVPPSDKFLNQEAYQKGEVFIHLNKEFYKWINRKVYEIFHPNEKFTDQEFIEWNNTRTIGWFSTEE